MGKRKTILDIHKDGWRTHLKMIKFGCHMMSSKIGLEEAATGILAHRFSIVSPFENNSTRAGATKLATVVVTSAPLPGHARHQRFGSCCTSTQKPNGTPSGELPSLYMSAAGRSVMVRRRWISISFHRRAEAGR